MKHLILFGLFLVILLPNWASATACTWDILDEDFDNNDLGWDWVGESSCLSDCTESISDGKLSIFCDPAASDYGCEFGVNVTELGGNAGTENMSMLFRVRYKMFNSTNNSANTGFWVGGFGLFNLIYDGMLFELNSNLEIVNVSSDFDWTDWITFLFDHVYDAGTAYVNVYVDGVFTANLTGMDAIGANRTSVTNFLDSTYFNDTCYIEVDYIRIAGEIGCGECESDSDCDSDEFCNGYTTTCEPYNINITATNYPDYVGVEVTSETVEETEDRHILYVDSSLYSNDSSDTDSWSYYDALLNESSDYQVMFFDVSGNVIGKSNTTSFTFSQCTGDADCLDEFGEGYWCKDGRCILESIECLDDGDCRPTQFCDLYQFDFYRTCQDKQVLTSMCTHDSECLSDNCTGSSQSSSACTVDEWAGGVACGWPDGRCEAGYDGYCWDFGICFNESVCTHDENCSDAEYCTVAEEGVGSGICFGREKSAYSPCTRDRICDNTTNNTYGEGLDCLSSSCSPESWECNLWGEGCADGLRCNWTTSTGLHECINSTGLGGLCTTDDECSPYKCLGGICALNETECFYNNPDRFGVPRPYEIPNSYCNGNPANTTGEWCYSNILNVSKGGAIPDLPDKKCYNKFIRGVACDYDYQCESLYCDYLNDSKVCRGQRVYVPVWLDGWLSGCEEVSSVYYECPAGGGGEVWVEYELLTGEMIKNATCTASSTAFTSTPKTLNEGTTAYLAPVNFRNNTNLNHSFEIVCFADGYVPVAAGLRDIHLVRDNTTYVKWDDPPNGTPFGGGSRTDFKINFRTVKRVGLSDASCTLLLDGDDHSMDNLYGGIYEAANILLPNAAGEYSYTVTCSKSGYVSGSATQTLTIRTSHCYNGVKDDDEEGKDCGGNDCKPCEGDVGKCDNGEFDSGEWGVDCEGICPDDCDYSDCRNGVQDTKYQEYCVGRCDIGSGDEMGVDCGGYCQFDCADGSCTDDEQNGDELKKDCGGRCEKFLGEWGGYCWCDPANDCGTADSPNDGRYDCDWSYMDNFTGLCITTNCSSDGDCFAVSWRSGYIEYNRTRVCDTETNLCRFGELGNYTTHLTMEVKPLSGLPPTGGVFVGNCEEDTNGIIVTTNIKSQKRYYFVTSPNSPSIPADTPVFGRMPYKFFADDEITLVSSDTIKELCFIPVGADYLYGRITLQAHDTTGTNFNIQYIDLLALREKFRVNLSSDASDADIINFTMNRNGSCFIRLQEGVNWTNLSTGYSNYQTYNTSDIAARKFFWLCNTTYGEEVDGRYSGGIDEITDTILGELYFGLTGSRFEWHGYYWIIIILLVFLMYPALTYAAHRKTDVT